MKVFLVISMTTLARAVRVITTERADLGGQGEMLDSSLKEYEEFSLCARFMTHQFRGDTEPLSAVLSLGSNVLLGKVSLGKISKTLLQRL